MKPISELIADREACEQIFKYFYGKAQLSEVKLVDTTVMLLGKTRHMGRLKAVRLRMEGMVSSAHDKAYNPRDFTSLMEKLGYSKKASSGSNSTETVLQDSACKESEVKRVPLSHDGEIPTYGHVFEQCIIDEICLLEIRPNQRD